MHVSGMVLTINVPRFLQRTCTITIPPNDEEELISHGLTGLAALYDLRQVISDRAETLVSYNTTIEMRGRNAIK